MNRKAFLKTMGGAPLAILAAPNIQAKQVKPAELKYDQRSHLEGGTYYCPNTLFSPEEIVEAGFVFVPHPTCIHKFDDPFHPIMKSYCDGSNTNLLPIVMKTRRFCVSYHKDYDPVDSPRWRGIEGVSDYFIKKDIFKPAIISWMKEMEFHYVHKVLLEDSPAFYEEKELSKKLGYPKYCYRHAVNVRGCRLPKIA